MEFMLNFFEFGSFPKEINMAWVVSIPKVDEMKELKHFRPISMVSCLYKII